MIRWLITLNRPELPSGSVKIQIFAMGLSANGRTLRASRWKNFSISARVRPRKSLRFRLISAGSAKYCCHCRPFLMMRMPKESHRPTASRTAFSSRPRSRAASTMIDVGMLMTFRWMHHVRFMTVSP